MSVFRCPFLSFGAISRWLMIIYRRPLFRVFCYLREAGFLPCTYLRPVKNGSFLKYKSTKCPAFRL